MDETMLQRAFYGALGLLALVLLGIGLAVGGAPGLAFGLFTVMVIGGALVCIWERSVVRSAFSLMATFTGIAGYFVLLESDFLAVAQILIYVGGILALLLFGVMLSPPDVSERKLNRVIPGLVIVGGAVGWVALRVAATVNWATEAGEPTGAAATEGQVSTARRIGVGFLAIDQYVVAFELAAVLLTVALVAAVYIARRKVSDLSGRPEAAGAGEGRS
jgi:NADH-quinone oxidoreductase subunit J